MPASNVDLANAALAYLGWDSIRDLEGDKPAAVQMAPVLEPARLEFIEEWDWPQSRVIGPLTAASNIALPPKWARASIYPSDCIALWRLTSGDDREVKEYEFGMSVDPSDDQTYIFTAAAGLSIRYGSSRTGLGRFSPKQFDMIAHKAAIKASLPLKKDVKFRDYLEKTYKTKLSALQTSFANREPELLDYEEVPELIRVRSQ